MSPENIRFLIIISILLVSGMALFVWSCITGKSKYQKMLEKRIREVNKN